MDCTFLIFGVLAIAFAYLSGFWSPLSYLAAIVMILMFILLILSIPLKLNWSSNLYGHLFWRFLSFLVFMLLVYALSYYMVGFESTDRSHPTFLDALYFSVTSFTTLQYGEYRPSAASRPLVCIESLMAIVAFIPFFATFGWLYCQRRIWPQSLEDETIPKNLTIEDDPVVGGWREVENERTKAEAQERNHRVQSIACARCGSSNPKMEKYYDIIGRTTPLALYVVHCSCGQISKPSTTAFLAAWRWKRLNKKESKSKKDHNSD